MVLTVAACLKLKLVVNNSATVHTCTTTLSNNTCFYGDARVCLLFTTRPWLLYSLCSASYGDCCSECSCHWVHPTTYTLWLWAPVLLLAYAASLSCSPRACWTAICGKMYNTHTHTNTNTLVALSRDVHTNKMAVSFSVQYMYMCTHPSFIVLRSLDKQKKNENRQKRYRILQHIVQFALLIANSFIQQKNEDLYLIIKSLETKKFTVGSRLSE